MGLRSTMRCRCSNDGPPSGRGKGAGLWPRSGRGGYETGSRRGGAMRRLAILVAIGFCLGLAFPAAVLAGPPEYEQAYVNGTTVTINAIELHQSEGALTHAAAD